MAGQEKKRDPEFRFTHYPDGKTISLKEMPDFTQRRVRQALTARVPLLEFRDASLVGATAFVNQADRLPQATTPSQPNASNQVAPLA